MPAAIFMHLYSLCLSIAILVLSVATAMAATIIDAGGRKVDFPDHVGRLAALFVGSARGIWSLIEKILPWNYPDRMLP
jgi:hypothetical protein